MGACLPTSAWECSHPRERQKWGGCKAFQVSFADPTLPSLSLLLISHITAVEVEAQRKGPAPKSLVVYRAGLERSRCSFLHADWPNGVWTLTLGIETQYLACDKQFLYLFLPSSPPFGLFLVCLLQPGMSPSFCFNFLHPDFLRCLKIVCQTSSTSEKLCLI